MTFPFSEEPITAEEERLIGKASGHLFNRCREAVGTSYKDQVGAEHDAMMRLRRRHQQVEAALAAQAADIARLREALEPSAGTKAAYCGEFSFTIEDRDEDGEECFRHVSVPWTTVKEIMAAIRARAALEGALL